MSLLYTCIDVVNQRVVTHRCAKNTTLEEANKKHSTRIVIPLYLCYHCIDATIMKLQILRRNNDYYRRPRLCIASTKPGHLPVYHVEGETARHRSEEALR